MYHRHVLAVIVSVDQNDRAAGAYVTHTRVGRRRCLFVAQSLEAGRRRTRAHAHPKLALRRAAAPQLLLIKLSVPGYHFVNTCSQLKRTMRQTV